jgi:hypothetical protein
MRAPAKLTRDQATGALALTTSPDGVVFKGSELAQLRSAQKGDFAVRH